jgi:hypothetical protein
MLYNLHFYKNDKFQEIRKEKIYMNFRFLELDVPFDYDKMMLFYEDSRYIVTYYYISRYKGKSMFERR